MLLELIEQSVLSLTSGGSIRSAAHSLPGQSTRVSERGYDLPSLTFIYFFFFFQAEDGIRDADVNWSSDVCSSDLTVAPFYHQEERWSDPIKELYHHICAKSEYLDYITKRPYESPAQLRLKNQFIIEKSRSEERRVGKECRSRWKTYH